MKRVRRQGAAAPPSRRISGICDASGLWCWHAALSSGGRGCCRLGRRALQWVQVRNRRPFTVNHASAWEEHAARKIRKLYLDSIAPSRAERHTGRRHRLQGSNPAIETSRPTVDELLRRAVEWCGRHPGAELLTTYHALARRYGVTTENATKDADPAGCRLPIGEPTGADRRGWPIKQEPAPIDFGPEEQRRRGLAVGVQRRARVADRDRAIIRASAGGATQRALAERFGLSRSSIRHVLDRHQAQRGRVATCGQRRQAAALTIRRDCRVAWRTWADASPTTRGR